LQTTRTTFLRLITLQLSQSRFTDGLTFIASDSARQEPRPTKSLPYRGTKKRSPKSNPPGSVFGPTTLLLPEGYSAFR